MIDETKFTPVTIYIMGIATTITSLDEYKKLVEFLTGGSTQVVVGDTKIERQYKHHPIEKKKEYQYMVRNSRKGIPHNLTPDQNANFVRYALHEIDGCVAKANPELFMKIYGVLHHDAISWLK